MLMLPIVARTAGALAAPEDAATKLLKPETLREGDAIAIIAPSTQVTDPSLLIEAERTAVYFGLKPKWGKHVKGHRAQGIATMRLTARGAAPGFIASGPAG